VFQQVAYESNLAQKAWPYLLFALFPMALFFLQEIRTQQTSKRKTSGNKTPGQRPVEQFATG